MIKKLIKLLLICLCVVCFSPNACYAQDSVQKVKTDIIKSAVKMGVDPYVVLSIAKLESNYDHKKRNKSGAIGVFQLMPRTAKLLGVNPYVQNENIKGGILYYSKMYKKYGSVDLALAAYNAGPGNVRKYNGVPPFKETRNFIYKVKKESDVLRADPNIIELHEQTKESQEAQNVPQDSTSETI